MASEFVKTEFIEESQNQIKVEASELDNEDEFFTDYLNDPPQSNFRYDHDQQWILNFYQG